MGPDPWNSTTFFQNFQKPCPDVYFWDSLHSANIHIYTLIYTYRPTLCQFRVLCVSADSGSEKSRMPPDRSPTPCYIERSDYQPGSTRKEIHFAKISSETFSRSLFPGFTIFFLFIYLCYKSPCVYVYLSHVHNMYMAASICGSGASP